MHTHQSHRLKILITIFLLLITSLGRAQQFAIPDSLQNRTINQLEELIRKNAQDSVKASFFSEILLACFIDNKEAIPVAVV